MLASYGYDTANRLEKQGYGFDVTDTSQSGMFIKYSYDLLDRPVQKEYYNGTNKQADYHYVYNAQGDLAKQYALNSYGQRTEEYQFEYDSLGRLIRSQEIGTGGELKQRTEHLYDTSNRLKSQSWVIGDDAFSESYTYNDPGNSAATLNSGSLATMTTATGDQLVYNYDTLHRLGMVHTKNSGGTTLFYTAQNYKTISSNRSSNQISGFSYRNSSGGIINYNTYTYDSVGNISAIYQVIPNGTRCLASYEYDSQNQLTQEIRYSYTGDNLTGTATTIIYDYDTAGNLLGSYNANGVNWITYTYANDNWSDLLTSIDVNGTTRTISYCGGNPTNWYNGNTYTNLTWTQGRRLSSLSKNGTNISYTYDMEGIRSSKTVGDTTYQYITQSGRVVREYVSSDTTSYTLDFIYDNSGKPFAMTYTRADGSSATFYYVLNAQGDVVALINSAGTIYASYTYDAWGNILLTESYNASYPYLNVINPLRYRGYYYDGETGFYYLQSRYYDPAVGRFINADSLIDAGAGMLGYNLFVYAANNPVNNSDPTGQWILSKAFKAGVKWLAKKVFRPVVRSIKRFLPKFIRGTTQIGLTGSAAAGISGTLSVGVAYDGQGNIGFFFSGGVGGGSPSASVSFFQTRTTAPSIDKLFGLSAQIGGSADAYGISFGAEINAFQDQDAKQFYFGRTVMAGIGAPIPAELHGDVTYTPEFAYINIFNIFDNIYKKIMEW